MTAFILIWSIFWGTLFMLIMVAACLLVVSHGWTSPLGRISPAAE